MILLTRLNLQPIVINATVVASVESDPDTLLTLLNGARIHVRETVEEVIARALEFQHRIHRGDLVPPAALAGHPVKD